MAKFEKTWRIAAPVERVFALVGDPGRGPEYIPAITRVEFQDGPRRGVGMRFTEYRKQGGSEAAVEFTCPEYEENRRIRLVGMAAGTEWDTLFELTPAGRETELRMELVSRPGGFFAGIIAWLIQGMVVRGVEGDVLAVKQASEAGS